MSHFSEHLIMEGFGYSFGLAVADLTGDGSLDITAADADGRALYWFQNDGQGHFIRHHIQRDHPKERLERHAIGDINGNGHLDVVCVENLTGDLYWLENNGTPQDGQLWTLHEITVGGLAFAYDVDLADFNGNGYLDVAASGWKGNEIAIFENPGVNGLWTKHPLDDKMAEARTIRVADFTDNGRPDILATGADVPLVAWYENPGQLGAPWPKYIIDADTPRPSHGHPIDLTGNGQFDVVMACGQNSAGGHVVWYENPGDPRGPWTRHTICVSLPNAFEAFAADIDGDGQIEVIVAVWGPEGGIYLFHQDGDPRSLWHKQPVRENWVRANQVLVADLTGDGRLDILAQAERGSNELRWWRNEGVL